MQETLYNIYCKPNGESQPHESVFMGQFWGILPSEAIEKVITRYGKAQKGFFYHTATAAYELKNGKVIRYFDPIVQERFLAMRAKKSLTV